MISKSIGKTPSFLFFGCHYSPGICPHGIAMIILLGDDYSQYCFHFNLALVMPWPRLSNKFNCNHVRPQHKMRITQFSLYHIRHISVDLRGVLPFVLLFHEWQRAASIDLSFYIWHNKFLSEVKPISKSSEILCMPYLSPIFFEHALPIGFWHKRLNLPRFDFHILTSATISNNNRVILHTIIYN